MKNLLNVISVGGKMLGERD